MIGAVRQHLLDTLADLRNKETPMDIARAKAVAASCGFTLIGAGRSSSLASGGMSSGPLM